MFFYLPAICVRHVRTMLPGHCYLTVKINTTKMVTFWQSENSLTDGGKESYVPFQYLGIILHIWGRGGQSREEKSLVSCSYSSMVQVGLLNVFEDVSDHQLGLRTIDPLLRPHYPSHLASLVMYSLIYFYSKKNKII